MSESSSQIHIAKMSHTHTYTHICKPICMQTNTHTHTVSFIHTYHRLQTYTHRELQDVVDIFLLSMPG